VDPWFIIAAAPAQSRLIRAAREVNDAKPQWVLDKVRAAAAAFSRPVIGCLGLTFKANVNDIRESPALAIARRLIAETNWQVMACDPYLDDDFKEFILHSFGQVLKQADILVLLVDHDEFKTVDRALLHGKIIIDTRGAWNDLKP